MSLNPTLEERRGGLPTGCPIRNLDDEAFEELWGDPDPWALAIVDPDLKISLAWLFAEAVTDTANKCQLKVLKTTLNGLPDRGLLRMSNVSSGTSKSVRKTLPSLTSSY
jgi:hypothetical protein